MTDHHQSIDPTTQAGQPTASGVQVNNLYTERRIKYYAITESEAVTLASENQNASAYFSLSTFLTGIGFSIWINALFYSVVNAAGELARSFVAPILLILGIVAFAMGYSARRRGSSLWSEIKTNSEAAKELQ